MLYHRLPHKILLQVNKRLGRRETYLPVDPQQLVSQTWPRPLLERVRFYALEKHENEIWLMKKYLCVSIFHSQYYCVSTQYLQGWTQHVLSLHLKGDETPADRHESLIFELASKKSNRVCSQTHTDCLLSFARWHASKDFISLFRKDTRRSLQSPLKRVKKTNWIAKLPTAF